MSDSSLQRKITSPPLPATHLHREPLVNRVTTALGHSVTGIEKENRLSLYKLILLHAPAGSGKTTLLVDVAQHTSVTCCWYHLDQMDTDRLTFLTTLLASIRQHFPSFGSTLDPLLTDSAYQQTDRQGNTNYFEMLINTLVAALEQEVSERFALFLCNYQEINDLPEMNSLVSLLLHRLPSQCLLVIESRVIPNLDFAQLLAGQLIFGLGMDQLRFSSQEIHELARLLGVRSLTDVEANQLALNFGGWIAGILLGTRLSNLSTLPLFRGPMAAPFFAEGPEHQARRQAVSPYLFSYVVNEVFKSHQEAYAFLKEACVLQEMPPATCAALLEISPDEAYQHLQELEQQNLFVTHRGEGSEIIYTCTPVLRKLLSDELRQKAPERFSLLHQRAAELLSAGHQYSQAISHALEASVNDIAASLIIQSAEQMINQGHAETVARWIDAFPSTTTNRYPKLLLIRANIYHGQRNLVAMSPLLDTAETAVQTLMSQASPLDPQNLPALQAEITILRSKILFRQQEYQRSSHLLTHVLASLPADEVELQANAHFWLSLCNIQLGDFATGIAQLQKALQLWGRHTIRHHTAEGHSLLARTYGLLGNFTLAEHHMARAIACYDQLQNPWGKSDNLARCGELKTRQGAFSEAENLLQEALRLASSPLPYRAGQAVALGCLADFYQLQARYERALELAEEAMALAREMHYTTLIYELQCDLALIYLSMGDSATAMILISEAEVLTASGDSIGYNRARRDLIYGMIHLSQRQYQQAWPYLSESEAAFRQVGVKQVHLQALLHLAAYHLAQGQTSDTIRCLNNATTIIPICEGYEQLAQLELRRLPELTNALKIRPELAQICKLFHLTPEYLPTGSHEEANLSETAQAVLASPPMETSNLETPLPKLIRYALTILALGEPAVYLHQDPVTRWRMARAMELCFYLLDCARPVRKETIITALWPEVDEQTTRTFYSTIYYLRQALGGEGIIVAKGGTYALKPDGLYGESFFYDVAAFLEAQSQAKNALEAQEDARARIGYLRMVELYRGDYLQPFYSDWSTSRRDELRQAYLEARQQLANIAWRAEEFDECIDHWQHILAIDDWLEEAHYGLMRCYTRLGKRGLALRQYQRCKDALEREFGIAPRASIQNLYQRLMG